MHGCEMVEVMESVQTTYLHKTEPARKPHETDSKWHSSLSAYQYPSVYLSPSLSASSSRSVFKYLSRSTIPLYFSLPLPIQISLYPKFVSSVSLPQSFSHLYSAFTSLLINITLSVSPLSHFKSASPPVSPSVTVHPTLFSSMYLSISFSLADWKDTILICGLH